MTRNLVRRATSRSVGSGDLQSRHMRARNANVGNHRQAYRKLHVEEVTILDH